MEEKPKHGRIYTYEDLVQLPDSGVSVVGQESASGTGSTAAPESKPKAASGAEVKSAPAGEEYWRGRARTRQGKMAALDAEIARVQENIANAAGNGYDIHIDILDLSLPDLLKEKADLQTQIEQLEEDARKSGADPGWLR